MTFLRVVRYLMLVVVQFVQPQVDDGVVFFLNFQSNLQRNYRRIEQLLKLIANGIL